MCSHDSLGSDNNQGQLGSSHARGPWAGGRPQRGRGGRQGADEARGGGKVQVCFSAARGWGVHLPYPSLASPPPKSPGPLSHFANDIPDLPTSFHPGATPWSRLPWSLTGTPAWPPHRILLPAWLSTFCSPHTARRIFPKCKSHPSHITLLLKPARGCLSN